MKMELTNELKEQYIMLYWGQPVMCYDHKSNSFKNEKVRTSLIDMLDGCEYLSLRPLSSITEEEIHGLCDLLWGDISYQDLYKLIFLNANSELQISNVVIDYLRSLGIATDFMGIPVEQWIEGGVVKLKEA